MSNSENNQDVVVSLQRGGYLVRTSAGYIQFGAPPETIKDTMILDSGVPRIFVLPDNMFHWQKGINLADMEFPIYFNFFLKKKKTYVVCTDQQARRVLAALQEAVFGPADVDVSPDMSPGEGVSALAADIKSEMDYYRGPLQFKDLVAFCILKNNEYSFGDVKIVKRQDGNFHVLEKDSRVAEVSCELDYQPKFEIGERLPEPYKPPLFGITCLGPSHGFDPTENTSGYIVWLNHTGIMIDPPVDSTEWLKDSNVNPKFIDSIILTHCHADHDAGTFQKILEEGRVTVYSTHTVMNSFLRKYSALSGESIDYLKELFTFHPVYIGDPLYIHGAEFRMSYRLHSIPTIGFSLKFQDQTFTYSSDHQAAPDVQKKLRDDGVISEERYLELQDFPWTDKVIYHESGIPPLHTPISYLETLKKDIQKRVVVYHIAKKDFPKKTHLTLASFGMENTLYFDTMAPLYEETYQTLSVLKHLDFFNVFPIEKIQNFISIIEVEYYSKGDVIIKLGTTGDKFYIIVSGNVAVRDEKLSFGKVFGEFEYFGEIALLTEQKRTADIIALTDVVAYSIEKQKFKSFIAGTEFESTLHRLIRNRNDETWEILNISPYFQQLTSYQKTWIESYLEAKELQGPGTLRSEGEPLEAIYVIREGEVHASKNGKTVTTLKRGDIVGAMHIIQRGDVAEYTFSYDEHVKLFVISGEAVREFLVKNPGIGMKLKYDF